MALTMKVRIEENGQELNIVIWNEHESVGNPIVNLKIRNNEVNGLSDISNKENSIVEIQKKNCVGHDNANLVAGNEGIESENAPNHLSMDNTGKVFKEDKENNSLQRSLIDSVLKCEDEEEDLSFASFLEYIKKKSEAFENVGHELSVSSKIFDTKQTDGCLKSDLNQTEDESSQRAIPPIKKKAIDTISVASDDYTLTIEDDSMERDDAQQNVENSKKECSTSTFRCQSCDKVFAKKTSHRQHMIAAHELKFACPICGIMFSLRKQLLLHLRIHGLKNFSSSRASPYPCSQCNRKYKSPKALKEHSKSHAPIQSRFFWRVSKMNSSLPGKRKIDVVTSGVPDCKSVLN